LVRDAVTKKTRRQNSGDYVKYNDDNVDDYEYGPGNAEYYEEPTQQGNTDSASIQERYLSAQSSLSAYSSAKSNQYADGEYYDLPPNMQTEEKRKWHTLDKVKTEESKNSIRIKEKTENNVVLKNNVAYSLPRKMKRQQSLN